MSDLISRSALMAHFKQEEWGTPDERWRPEREFGRMVLNAPAVDAVEVVRCGECKWANSRGECAYNGEEAEDIKMCYCSYGERKNEVEE